MGLNPDVPSFEVSPDIATPSSTYRDRMNMAMLFMNQVNRCSLAAMNPDPSLFEVATRILHNMLPAPCYQDVLDNSDKYNLTTSQLIFTNYCGVDQGHKNAPLMQNKEEFYGGFSDEKHEVVRDEDGVIDWDDPNIISPKKVTRTDTDYELLFAEIQHVAEKAGLTWKSEDVGKAHDTNARNAPRIPKILDSEVGSDE